MRRPLRAAFALLFVGAFGQSCVLEPLEADRVAEGGSGGASAGSDSKAGRGGSQSGASGTAAGAGTPQGGFSGAGVGGGVVGGGGSGGANAGEGGAGDGSAGEGGATDVPPVDWGGCDPTFSDAYQECPALQPQAGMACDDELFFPEDFCAFCENPRACPVETDFVTLRCVNRAWRASEVFRVGCCPDQRPTHGAACDSQAYCEYDSFSDICECVEGTWHCCGDAYDGGPCNQQGDQCIFSYSAIDADRCTCTGVSPDAVWSCCPYFPPPDGTTCYYDPITCAYPDQTCTCPAYASNWSCE